MSGLARRRYAHGFAPPGAVSLREYLEAQIQFERLLSEANDRRYYEVNVEREKALKIKETADLAALQLAREIQTYKDEKANELREQISSERGLYATHADVVATTEKLEALIAPLATFVNAQQGRTIGAASQWTYLVGGLGAISTLILLFLAIGGHLH
jgi:vacuolar-type H+-ATPase subunit H